MFDFDIVSQLFDFQLFDLVLYLISQASHFLADFTANPHEVAASVVGSVIMRIPSQYHPPLAGYSIVAGWFIAFCAFFWKKHYALCAIVFLIGWYCFDQVSKILR